MAEALSSLAIGDGAGATSRVNRAARANTTAYVYGDVVVPSTPANASLFCLIAGTSAAAEPAILPDKLVVDGTATWFSFTDTNTADRALAVGSTSEAEGDSALAIGQGARGFGGRALAIGEYAKAFGQNTIALRGEVYGTNSVVVNSWGQRAREVEQTYLIGPTYPAVSNTGKIVGPDYIPVDDGVNPDGAPAITAYASAKPHVFTSPPVCLGAKPWQASTAYNHGDVVTPTAANGRSYFAYVWDSSTSYFTSGTSGPAEPSTWSDTVYSGTSDNDISWICIDPTSVIMTLPDYLRFIPTEVGFIGQADTGAGIDAAVSFGISGALAKWVTTETLTQMTGPYASHAVRTLDNTEGAKTLAASLLTPGTGATTGRFYWRGICVESMDA